MWGVGPSPYSWGRLLVTLCSSVWTGRTAAWVQLRDFQWETALQKLLQRMWGCGKGEWAELRAGMAVAREASGLGRGGSEEPLAVAWLPPLLCPQTHSRLVFEFRWFLEVQLFALVQDLLAGFSPAFSSPGDRDAAGSPR